MFSLPSCAPRTGAVRPWLLGLLLGLLALLPQLAAATNPTLLIQGQGSGTADITAFVDQVQILDASGNVVAGAVGDASFEAVSTSGYVYQPAGSAWTFIGNGSGTGPGAGLTANGSAFSPPTAPDGTQAAFVQRTGYLRQVLTLGAGTYRVRLQMAQRGSNSMAQQLDVQVLGVSVGVASLGSSTAYATYTSNPFTVTSGAPTITGFSPSRAVAGTTVTLTGTNLSGTSRLTVNGAAASGVLVQTNQQLTFIVSRSTPVTNPQQVTLTTPDGTVSSAAFTVTGSLVSTDPAANARRAPRLGSPVGLTFNEAVAANTLGNLAVFSAQVGGRKAGQWTGGGTLTVNFRSTLPGGRANFQPGELVSVSVPSSVQTTSGSAVPQQVVQFTTAVGGTGVGNFNGGTTPAVSGSPVSVVVGDVNGDGNLDLLTANGYDNTVSVRLNDGAGTFSGGSNLTVGRNPRSIAVGDLDGDGNLDLLTANSYNNTVSVRLNDGTGTFSGSDFTVSGSPYSVAVGDVDGDGDLDLLTANHDAYTASVRLNDGAGHFSGGSNPAVGTSPTSVAVGDVDGDGDLDLLVGNSNSVLVNVRLNDGAGHFSGGSNPVLNDPVVNVVVGDVDGDGDLDLLAGSFRSYNAVSVRLNDGAGHFSGGSDLAVDSRGGSHSVAVGDVDGDGDLDLLTANQSSGSVSVRLNDGAGNFSGGSDPAVGISPYSVAVGDVDGDGDLDLLAANNYGNTVSVRFNQPPAPTLAAASPAAAGVGIPVTLTGTGLGSATGVTVGGTAATITASSATSLTFLVPTSVVPGTYAVAVTTPSGAASLTYTVLAAPGNALAFDGSGDYVSLPQGVVTALQNDFTLELWLRTTQPGSGSRGGQWWQGTGLLDGNVTGPAADYGLSLLADRVAFGVGDPGSGTDATIQSTTAVTDGRWHYVVATRQASTGALALYVDGQPQATGTGTTAPRMSPPQLTLGVLQTGTSGSNFFQGSLDEVRLWSLVRPAADVAAAYQAGPQTNLSQSGLVAYYSIDEGQPSGPNTGVSQLFDLTANALHGTLTGFTRTGATTNFVASYALVVPTATAATNPTPGGFTANWTPPVVGTLDNYLLDVSTAADFSVPVAGSPFAVAAGTTSQPLTGLPGGSTYYRVRAELSSLTGQGAPSNVVAVNTTPLPVQLVSFTATAQGNQAVRLAWTTASELNSAYFAVERSLDGRTFVPLGQVPAAGRSATARAYGYTDAPAPPGLLYYRLRQVDVDGRVAYSPVRTVTLAAAGLVLYPNPAQGSTTLVGAEAGTVVQLLDAVGRVVLTTTTDATGTANLLLPAELASGVYVVRAGGHALRLHVE